MRIDEPDYFSHSNHTDIFTKDLKKSLIHFLNQPNKSINKLTNYEACILIWNTLNENYDIDFNAMPNYEQLETKG